MFKTTLSYPRPSLKMYKRTQKPQDPVLDVRVVNWSTLEGGVSAEYPRVQLALLEIQIHRGYAEVT